MELMGKKIDTSMTIEDLAGTVEDLAEMINKGFTEMQRHVDNRIDEVKDIQKNMLTELNTTHEDVRYLRNTMNSLAHGEAAQDRAIENLETRVYHLEKNAA